MRYLYVLPFVEGKDFKTNCIYVDLLQPSCFSENAELCKRKRNAMAHAISYEGLHGM